MQIAYVIYTVMQSNRRFKSMVLAQMKRKWAGLQHSAARSPLKSPRGS